MRYDNKMEILNNTIRDFIPYINKRAAENPQVEIRMNILKFSTSCEWMSTDFIPVDQFVWDDLKVQDGACNLGKALTMVANLLKLKPSGIMDNRGFPPVIVLALGGSPTDDWETGIRALMEVPWAKTATRNVVNLSGSNKEIHHKFIGKVKTGENPNDCIFHYNQNDLSNLAKGIKWVSDAARGTNEKPYSDTITDIVHFTITAPKVVVPDSYFVLDVWAHLPDQEAEVLRQMRELMDRKAFRSKTKRSVPVKRESNIEIHLTIPDLHIDNPDDLLYWDGTISTASFSVKVPSEIQCGDHRGTVKFYFEGSQIARLEFLISVGEEESEIGALNAQEKLIRSAFVSYASGDRKEVLSRIQGIAKIIPNIDFFMDVYSLHSGQKWENRLSEEILKRDIFYLFWSLEASRSKWVEKEWRLALKLRGIDFIDPIPLQPPDEVPPPPELGRLHFNDWMLAYQRTGPKRDEDMDQIPAPVPYD